MNKKKILLLLISYGATLFLFMPSTAVAIVTAVSLLILGIGLMIRNKLWEKVCWDRGSYFLLPNAVLVAVSAGLIFYTRWIPSSKLGVIAAAFHMTSELLLFVISGFVSLVSVYFICIALRLIYERISNPDKQELFKESLIACVAVSLLTVLAAQVMLGMRALSMGWFHLAWGVLIILTVVLLLYCVFGKIFLPTLIGGGAFMIISSINVYIYQFRSRLFEPVDFFSIGTAMNVLENYSLFPIPLGILGGWGLFVAMLIMIGILHRKAKRLTVKRRFVLLAVCAVCSATVCIYTATIETVYWQKSNALSNGYILDFASKVKEVVVSKPEHYNTAEISDLADRYAVSVGGEEEEPAKHPHIIVIMNEAFSDLNVLGDVSTNIEVLPFISSLKENVVSGYALASVYGGNTANSEYEFLTGNSMAWLSPNVVPYQQYIRSSTYSMVSYLKSSYDYKCVAMHPFYANGWERPAAYGYLGFDECYFIEDFPNKHHIRDYISDQEMFEFLIDTYEKQKGEPLFLFGVTMQNHGKYNLDEDRYTKHISLDKYGKEFPDVEQYLSLVHETDKAVERLITYFQTVEDDVVIVFFGDHQPKIDEAFYDLVSGVKVDTLDEMQRRYKIPFFIWANYDIEEKQLDPSSLNYLSTHVYDAAGIPLPPYNRFLQEMERVIPAINANGFYSLEAGRYLSVDEANEEERQWLEQYESLQYNSLFGKEDQNKTLFPVLK